MDSTGQFVVLVLDPHQEVKAPSLLDRTEMRDRWYLNFLCNDPIVPISPSAFELNLRFGQKSLGT